MTFPEIRVCDIFCLGRAKDFSVLGVFTAVRFAAETTYRRAIRRKTNLEVTGEEKPKTRLRRRKVKKRLCREKSQFGCSQMKKSQFHLSQTKKSLFAPSSGEELQQTTFRARKKSKFLS